MDFFNALRALALLTLCLGAAACVQPGPPANEIPGDPPRICALNAGDPVPTTLSATGLFSDAALTSPINGFHEYELIAPLHSDNAQKRRWMWLPKNTAIGFSASESWDYPVGTCFVKEFDLELAPAAAAKNPVRVETRVLIKNSEGWVGYTYEWNDEQADATLLADGKTRTFTIADAAAPNGTRQQLWTYPSRNDCLTCHNAAAGGALGPRTLQLNRAFSYAAGAENQLTHWNDQGLFKNDISDPAQYGAYAAPHDTTQPVELRARSYLAANCMHCHQPGATAVGGMDMRFSTAVKDMGLIGVAPSRGDLGVPLAYRIDPGSKESSIAWLRMMSTDSYRMPSLGTSLVDPVGTEVVGKWIDNMATH